MYKHQWTESIAHTTDINALAENLAPRRAVAERTDTASRAISRRSDLARLRDPSPLVHLVASACTESLGGIRIVSMAFASSGSSRPLFCTMVGRRKHRRTS